MCGNVNIGWKVEAVRSGWGVRAWIVSMIEEGVSGLFNGERRGVGGYVWQVVSGVEGYLMSTNMK